MFHGSMVALVTPMHQDGAIDFESLRRLLDWHIESLTDAIVVLGSTGESATIDQHERTEIINRTIEQVAGRVPVIVGTGTNCTKETIRRTRQAMELGADGCLLVTPYYNKPTQEGLFQHFKAVAEAVAIPQILYNVPSRTGCDMLPETVARLATIPNIVGLKESTGDVSRVGKILDLCGDTLTLFSGEDDIGLDFMLAGGKGIISVTANVAPQQMHTMCSAVLNADVEKAKNINAPLMPIHKLLFSESNPIPVKWALHRMEKIPLGIRLPLTMLSESKREPLFQAMKKANIV